MSKRIISAVLGVLVFLGVESASATEYEQAWSKALRNLGEPVRFCPKVKLSDELLKVTLVPAINVQKVVPRNFSPEAVKSLLQIGEINPNEVFKGANRGVFGTSGVKYYGSPERNHTLTVIPAQGWIRYACLGAITNRVGIAPDETETVRRGLEMAKLLGLNQDTDLMKHPKKNRFDYALERTERDSYKQPTRIVSQAVFFRRAIEGIRVVTGHYYGGLQAGFGINGQLHEVELTARATQPLSAINVAPFAEQTPNFSNRNQVVALKETGFWNQFKNDTKAELMLVDVETVYFEDAPEKFQKIIPPLLRWEGSLNWDGKSETIIFFTPIREK